MKLRQLCVPWGKEKHINRQFLHYLISAVEEMEFELGPR